MEIATLDDPIHLPPALTHSSTPTSQKLQFVQRIAAEIVKECTLINPCSDVQESDDGVYNYARVLCHYSALIAEFKDAWAEGDGERVYRCWCIMLPHFKSSGRTKYTLEALRLQFQVRSCLSPQLAHQVVWDRFVNVRGGAGRNIPCDLYNEHIVKLIKTIITNMGPNLTEKSLQRAARSVSTLHLICKQFDGQSDIPVTTSAHSTKADKNDVQKVVTSVLNNKLLQKERGRKHNMYRTMKLNPLWNWSKEDTIEWIQKKRRDFIKFQCASTDDKEAAGVIESDEESDQ